MNFLWVVGVYVALIQAYEGERGAFITADEDNALGLGGGLDASLDRISSKLQQEKMNRLLSLDDDALTGLLKSHEPDDVMKDTVKPVRSTPVEEPQRLKQVAHTSDAAALKGLKEQLATMVAQQASLLAKQENVQKELAEIQATMHKQESRDKDASAKLDMLKSDIISAVSHSIQQSKHVEIQPVIPPNSRFQLPDMDEVSSKRNVLAALKKTLSDLKSQVLHHQGEQGSSNNFRFNQRPQFSQASSQRFSQWQPYPYNDGSQKVRRLQDKVIRTQDSWADAGDPNYVDAFAPQGTPIYSDQTLGAYSPDYAS